MKATINLEYGSEELEKFLANAGVTLLKRLLGSIKIDPNDVPYYADMFKQGFLVAMDGMAQKQQHAHHHHRGPNGVPHPREPFGGPLPPPQGVPSQDWEIRRQQLEEILRQQLHDRCFPVESSRHIEGGIGCCQCRTYNGAQRVNCRNCGHKLCVIATPTPAAPDGEGA